MNKKLTAWIAGGLLTATVFAFGYNNTIGSAAEKISETIPRQEMMPNGQQDMSKMMINEELLKQCQQIMDNPEMQKAMQTMMDSPEMQQMMQTQNMMPANGSQQAPCSNTSQTNVDPADHAAHHSAK